MSRNAAAEVRCWDAEYDRYCLLQSLQTHFESILHRSFSFTLLILQLIQECNVRSGITSQFTNLLHSFLSCDHDADLWDGIGIEVEKDELFQHLQGTSHGSRGDGPHRITNIDGAEESVGSQILIFHCIWHVENHVEMAHLNRHRCEFPSWWFLQHKPFPIEHSAIEPTLFVDSSDWSHWPQQ